MRDCHSLVQEYAQLLPPNASLSEAARLQRARSCNDRYWAPGTSQRRRRWAEGFYKFRRHWKTEDLATPTPSEDRQGRSAGSCRCPTMRRVLGRLHRYVTTSAQRADKGPAHLGRLAMVEDLRRCNATLFKGNCSKVKADRRRPSTWHDPGPATEASSAAPSWSCLTPWIAGEAGVYQIIAEDGPRPTAPSCARGEPPRPYWTSTDFDRGGGRAGGGQALPDRCPWRPVECDPLRPGRPERDAITNFRHPLRRSEAKCGDRRRRAMTGAAA